ncbi:N,N-dimethylformamidase beta subunit family domain-containing protein [Hyalangium rubrum]|uniref:DUF6605 domain-containing protein n=1 Tax=Hyalangium rubrum TaxID=3103134 RepID=A0ABU5HC71_9BACT|nr:N,N-dimethylformamidase beta subunit family domain-containing protein [Hyalangium sp. s54d21]MDY7230709.1 DUF6605 domain-containing protein [Hyalangium sp. s54d21]
MARRSVREVPPLEAPGESAPRGDPSWRKGKPASPAELEVLTSAQAALAGEQVLVEVSSLGAPAVRAEVFRLGVYGGAGALKVWSSKLYASASPSGRMTFSFEIAEDWEPGLYLVKVTRSDGLRSFTSLVVKERKGEAPPT